jgi:hypothetical protein
MGYLKVKLREISGTNHMKITMLWILNRGFMKILFLIVFSFSFLNAETKFDSKVILEYHMCHASHLVVTEKGTVYHQEAFLRNNQINHPKISRLTVKNLETLEEKIENAKSGKLKADKGPRSKGCKGYLFAWSKDSKEVKIRHFYPTDAYWNVSNGATDIVKFVNSYAKYKVSETGAGVLE